MRENSDEDDDEENDGQEVWHEKDVYAQDGQEGDEVDEKTRYEEDRREVQERRQRAPRRVEGQADEEQGWPEQVPAGQVQVGQDRGQEGVR